MEDKYYCVNDFAKKIDVTPREVLIWDKKNILKPHHISELGKKKIKKRYYSQEQIDNYHQEYLNTTFSITDPII